MTKQTIGRTWLCTSTVLLLAAPSACSADDPEPTSAPPASVASGSDAPTTIVSEPLPDAEAESTEREVAAIELVTDFLKVYWAHDADRSLQFLSDEGIASTGSDTPEEFRLMALQTKIWKYRDRPTEPCQTVESSPTNVLVRCAYEFDAFGSDELGVGPFTGNYLDISVRDGKVDSLIDHDVNYRAVSESMWDPFERWARANHPEDIDMLFGDGWLTEESFRIWEQRLGEYLDEQLGT